MQTNKITKQKISLLTKSLNIIQFNKELKIPVTIKTNPNKINNKSEIKIIIITGQPKTIHCSELL